MNIGLFGGTFDPIHLGHTALARAAMERFALGRIYFVPAGIPPHKRTQVTDYVHRYAMVALATMAEKAFVPSLLEAPETASPHLGGKKGQSSNIASANFTIDTVRRLQSSLKKADRLYFLIGVDAFNDIAKWHEAEALLRSCEFIVASRPGYSLADIANALPEILRPKAEVTRPFSKQPARGDLVLPGVTIHLLENVQQNISATAIRDAVSGKRALTRFLDPAVAGYIKKMDLYRGR
ncbi:MAG: nicotinate (nicotinamide) nucleotide adenylyltransferase [Acidobacteriaceae bacterium]|nr:nicotinate (nicotinamide) nucleotide adenylyltransferase [Acidobacteriaceae bacterium]